MPCCERGAAAGSAGRLAAAATARPGHCTTTIPAYRWCVEECAQRA